MYRKQGAVPALWVSLIAPFALLAQAAHADGTIDAVIPMEILPPDPAIASGELWTGGARWSAPQIALQPARIARAIATDEGSGKTRVLVLAVLGTPERTPQGQLKLDVPPDRQAWCDLPGFGMPSSRCYQDTNADGKLDTLRKGLLAGPSPITLNRVGEPEPISPIAFAPAREDQLRLYHIGYTSCGAPRGTFNPAAPEHRYATAIREASGMHWPPPQTCTEIAKLTEQTDGGDRVFQFGRFKVAVHEEKGALKTRLVEGMPAGTLLGHLRLDQPLMDAAQASETLASRLSEKPFLYFVAAPRVASNVAAGEEILSAEVAHGLTGKLSSPMQKFGWTGSEAFPAGTPVFGLPMSNSLRPASWDPDIVWCMPARDKKSRWDTRCVAKGNGMFVLTPSPTAFVVSSLSVSGPGVTAPIVDRGPVDFGGPLVMSVRYKGAERRYVQVMWGVGLGGEPDLRQLRLRRAEDGAAYFVIGEAIVAVKPTADGKSATLEMKGEVAADQSAVPDDAYEVLKESK